MRILECKKTDSAVSLRGSTICFFAPIPYRSGGRSYEEAEKMDTPELSIF